MPGKTKGLALKITANPTSEPLDSLPTPLTSAISRLSSSSSSAESLLNIVPYDLIKLCGIGHGNGGTVDKVLHSPTGTIMARKTITIDQEFHETLKKQIRRELNILSECCNCQFIVKFFGAFVGDGDISICMEYMDLGSLDGIYRTIGKIPEPIIGQITISILEGLVYLYQKHKIIHRDIKPSNILFNSQGQIKLCDFGVSGEALLNSLASTFVGTDAYMSPERLQSKPYATQSDTWSMGITLMELALGKYPFENFKFFELLEFLVNEEIDILKDDNEKWTSEFKGFLASCLVKDPVKRFTPLQLLRHDFVVRSRNEPADLRKWAQTISVELQK